VDIPDTVTQIGEYAFGFTDDDEGKFHNIDDFVINANFDTEAKKYAKQHDVDINYLDGNPDTIKYVVLICVGVVVLAIVVFVIVKIILNKKKEKEYYNK